jgi:3-oxoacyl-[acyl-carrier-protein] synthase II
VGIVSALGGDAATTMGRLMAGDRAIGPITLFDVSAIRCKVGAEVRGLSVKDVAPAGQGERWSRTDALALLAAKEALRTARVDGGLDLVVAGSTAGMFECEERLAVMSANAALRVPEPGLVRRPLSATADRLREVLGPFRRARSLCSACASGSSAIALAAAWLRAGRSERVLVGGADALSRLTFGGFDALRVTDLVACRPFDRARAGVNLGEGAAFIVLESDASARARSADPIAELAGYALGSEAAHITQPEEDGATVTHLLRRALEMARIDPAEVDWVHAHGTGTQRNDVMEATALRAVLGAEMHARVTSSKGQLGHTLGAAGALGAAIATLAIARGELPPTGGLEDPDPACAIPLIIGQGQKAHVRIALANAFGFGGMDSVLVFRRPDAAPPPEFPHRVLARPGGASTARDASRDEVARTTDAWVGRALPRIFVRGGATMGTLGLLDVEESRAYAEQARGAPAAGMLAVTVDEGLDLERARRFDRCTRMLVAVFDRALRSEGRDAVRTAAIAATAFGPIDEISRYCARSSAAGWRSSSPAVFPNLVPSSPVAHAAIYHQLRGPSFVVGDVGTSMENAVLSAIDLIRDGHVEVACAGAFAECSDVVAKVFNPLLLGSNEWHAVPTEGACSLVLETEGPGMAEITSAEAGFDEPILPVRPERARLGVVVGRADARVEGALAKSEWRDVPVTDVSLRAGAHEANGGFALVVAASLIAAGELDAALVLGSGLDRWAAFLLERT